MLNCQCFYMLTLPCYSPLFYLLRGPHGVIDWEVGELGSSPQFSLGTCGTHLHHDGAGPNQELKLLRPTRTVVSTWPQWPLSPGLLWPCRKPGPVLPDLAVFKRIWECRFLYRMSTLKKILCTPRLWRFRCCHTLLMGVQKDWTPMVGNLAISFKTTDAFTLWPSKSYF